MPSPPEKEVLTPSILESLRTRNPDDRTPLDDVQGLTLDMLRESVLRDLRRLLNTRNGWRPVEAGDTLLRQSVANYGVPDFSGFSLGSEEAREALRRTVEETVRNFEPRLSRVRVRRMPDDIETSRRLRLQIEAELLAEPRPVRIVFDTQVEPVLRTLAVEENLG